MLDFREINLEDKDLFKPYLQAPGELMSTRCFPVIYLWSGHFETGYCVREGFLFASTGEHRGRYAYMMPLGEGSILPALEIIERDAARRNMPYSIYLTGRGRLAEIEAAFPGKYIAHVHRSGFDYIYDPKDLMELKGKKFQSKRNFINRFLKEQAGRWEYRPVDPDADAGAIMDFARFWQANHNGGATSASEEYELRLVERALENYRALELLGGVLTVSGSLVAFTFAAPGPDKMLDVMFEKADASLAGAYPMINQQFALANFAGFDHINREDDMGIEGLRTAKLSYHPVSLTEKFVLEPVC